MLGRFIPDSPVITISGSSTAKDETFLEDNREPDCDEVAHKREEVGEDICEVAAARESAYGVYYDTKGVPDRTGHLFSIPA